MKEERFVGWKNEHFAVLEKVEALGNEDLAETVEILLDKFITSGHGKEVFYTGEEFDRELSKQCEDMKQAIQTVLRILGKCRTGVMQSMLKAKLTQCAMFLRNYDKIYKEQVFIICEKYSIEPHKGLKGER
jgi:hypothetical protein